MISDIQNLYNQVREIIASARQNATRSVDFCRVQMYWSIGKRILETEQALSCLMLMPMSR